jgi:hypothetical protein
MTTVKALSVRQPWATLICTGDKTIEWRSWQTKYRGELLICASGTPSEEYRDIPVEDRIDFPLGVATGSARLVDIHPFSKADFDGALFDWLPDPPGFAWVFDNQVFFHEQAWFPVKGKLHIFDVQLPFDI